MAANVFLFFEGQSKNGVKIEGLTKDSTYKDHKAIELMSWSFAESNPVSGIGSATGRAAGKVLMNAVTCVKLVDTTSPMFMLACAQGDHMPKASIHICKAGLKVSTPYMKIELETVFVTSYSVSMGGDEPVESISLDFGKITYSVAPQDNEGAVGTFIPANWNVEVGSAQ